MNNLPFSFNLRSSADSWGAIASAICLAHCVLTPFLFIAHAHTHAERHLESGLFWWGTIDYVFLLISLIAVYHSAKHTSLRWMPAALYTSWILLTLYIVSEKFQLLHLGHGWVYLPAVALIGLHLYNKKYCQCEEEACCASKV